MTLNRDALDCCVYTSDIARRQHLYGPPTAVSCLCRDTTVRCSVDGPFLWPARRPGTRYQTTFEIRRVLLTVFVVTWKLFFSHSTSDYALYKSTIDVDIDIDAHTRSRTLLSVGL